MKTITEYQETETTLRDENHAEIVATIKYYYHWHFYYYNYSYSGSSGISVYDTIMEIVFITSTCYLIYSMRVKPPVSQTYDRDNDNFRYDIYFVPACFVLALLVTEGYTTEIMWTASIWL